MKDMPVYLLPACISILGCSSLAWWAWWVGCNKTLGPFDSYLSPALQFLLFPTKSLFQLRVESTFL